MVKSERATEQLGLNGMSKKKLPPEVLEYFRQQGAKGGKIGGSKAWENLTAEERSARARKKAGEKNVTN